MNIKLYDNATVTSKFFTTTEFPIYLTTWSRKLDPDALAYIYTSTGVYNAAKIGNPQIDALVAKGSAEYDQQKRFAIYHQINQMVTDDAWFTVGLYGQSYIGYWKDVYGGADTSFNPWGFFMARSVWHK
jgi:ABC-type transport system substrate-binding protein